MNNFDYATFYKVFDRFPTKEDEKKWTRMKPSNKGKIWNEKKVSE